MKSIRPWTAYAMIVGGFVAGVATVVSMTGGFKASTAFAHPNEYARLVGGTTAEESVTLHNLNSSLTNLADFVKPAVVHIRSTTRASDADGKLVPISGSEGAGFIYRKDGYVITNDHVIGGATEVTVITNDGREYKGSVKRAPEWDVAVVKIEGNDFPTLGLADSKTVKPGQMVMAIGSPYGLENSVTFGHVSAIGRENAVPDSATGQPERFYPDLIQTDAAINVGNSGGPLVNIDGQVVGMNSSIYTKTGGSNGIAFAIPSSQVRFIADILIQKGKVVRSQLGIYPRDLKPFEKTEKKMNGGAYVEDVSPGGPADKAGIKKGDIVVNINSKAIDGQIDLRNSMLEQAPKTTVKVEYVRDGRKNSASVVLEEAKPAPAATPRARTYQYNDKDLQDLFNSPDMKDLQGLREKLKRDYGSGQKDTDDEGDVLPLRSDKPKLGVSIDELNSETRKRNLVPDNVKGVLITRVDSNSVAAKSGLNPGDIIEAVGGHKIESVQQLTEEMARLSWGAKTTIKVGRYGKNSKFNFEKEITFK